MCFRCRFAFDVIYSAFHDIFFVSVLNFKSFGLELQSNVNSRDAENGNKE